MIENEKKISLAKMWVEVMCIDEGIGPWNVAYDAALIKS